MVLAYPDRPTVCPRGHQLGPGQFRIGSYRACEQCGGGHNYLTCNTCLVRIALGHDGAVWEIPDRYGWKPL